MESLQIQELVEQCMTLFRARSLAYSDAEDEEVNNEKQIFETQNARFNLWADTIGNYDYPKWLLCCTILLP
jgi:hypothetical protein